MKYGEGVSEASVKGKGLVGVVNAEKHLHRNLEILPECTVIEISQLRGDHTNC
jgi:hypothetical protein